MATNVSLEEKVLEVGCGTKKDPGVIGIDCIPGPLVDVVHDINVVPWPFKDDTFDEVRLSQIIEHVNDILVVMKEVHRVAKNNARVLIWTPHYSSFNSWTDPTHKHHLAYRSFDYFLEPPLYDYKLPSFRLDSRRILFGKGLISYPGKWIVFLSPMIYEKYFAFIFPARDMEFKLTVLKG
jgi:SAM-dependent methyltransferase